MTSSQSEGMISLPGNVDVSKITYGTPKALDNGGKMIYLYHDKKPLVIQIPSMMAPYGVSKWENDKGGPDKYNLDVAFTRMEENPVIKEFFDLMQNLDKKLVDDGLANSANWFKKKMSSRDVVEAIYTPLVKHARDKETGEITDKYPPTVRFQLPFRDGKFQCEVYNNKREQININDVDMKRANVTAIVQCTGIWVAGGKYGCTFKALQMKVDSSRSKIEGYAFIDDEDDTAAA
jgi:hypothetical protein